MSDKAVIASLLGQSVPHGIGISIAPDGSILKRPDAFPFEFSFCFSGRLFQCRVSEDGPDVKIGLSADFGILPYTLENPQRRANILHVLEAMESAGIGWHITPDQRVHFALDFPVDHSATPSVIIAALIVQLMPLQGWFDLLAEICTPLEANAA